MEIKCKNFYIIKICYYADKHLSRKYDDKIFNDKKVRAQHYERVKQYNEFKWKFIEHITKETQKYWYFNYMIESDKCAFEQIYEQYGIISEVCAEGWYYYYIPKDLPDIIECMKDNLSNPYKILKKCKHIPMKETNLTWQREYSRKFTIELQKENSILKSIENEK